MLSVLDFFFFKSILLNFMAKYKLHGLTFYVLFINVFLPIAPWEEPGKSNKALWHTEIIDVRYKQRIKWEHFTNNVGLQNGKKGK